VSKFERLNTLCVGVVVVLVLRALKEKKKTHTHRDN